MTAALVRQEELHSAVATGTLVMDRRALPASGVWPIEVARFEPTPTPPPMDEPAPLVEASFTPVSEILHVHRRAAVKLRRTSVVLALAFAFAAGLAGSLAIELSTRPELHGARVRRDAFGGAHRLERD